MGNACLSLSFIVWKALVGPVRGKIIWQQQNAKIFEAQFAEGRECGTNIRTLLHRATTAVKNHVAGARQSSGPGLQLCQPFRASATAVKLRAMDMASGEQSLKSDKNN